MTDGDNTTARPERQAPGISVAVHIEPTSRIDTHAIRGDLCVYIDGDGYESLSLFFPDDATGRTMRDKLTGWLEGRAS